MRNTSDDMVMRVKAPHFTGSRDGTPVLSKLVRYAFLPLVLFALVYAVTRTWRALCGRWPCLEVEVAEVEPRGGGEGRSKHKHKHKAQAQAQAQEHKQHRSPGSDGAAGRRVHDGRAEVL